MTIPPATHLVAERYRFEYMPKSEVHYSYACPTCVADLCRQYGYGHIGARRLFKVDVKNNVCDHHF